MHTVMSDSLCQSLRGINFIELIFELLSTLILYNTNVHVYIYIASFTMYLTVYFQNYTCTSKYMHSGTYMINYF